MTFLQKFQWRVMIGIFALGAIDMFCDSVGRVFKALDVGLYGVAAGYGLFCIGMWFSFGFAIEKWYDWVMKSEPKDEV